MSTIRYFVIDIDGCLSIPTQAPSLSLFTRLRALAAQAREDSTVPALSILSGRPQPYVEAMVQMLDIDQPTLFESGAGMFHASTMSCTWHPAWDAAICAQMQEVRAWFDECLQAYPTVTREFAKRYDIGAVCTDPLVIEALRAQVAPQIAQRWPMLCLHHTDVSVNILYRQVDKGAGLRWFAQTQGVSLSEVAYIGDSSGDIPALKLAGQAFAPANATPEVQAIAQTLPESSTAAVERAWRRLIAHNRAQG